MRRAILVIALAACGGKKSAPPPAHHDAGAAAPRSIGNELTLPASGPAVGLVIHEDSTQSSQMTLSRGTETSVLKEDEHEVSRAEVLAVEGGAITRIRIHYETKQRTTTVHEEPTVEASPLEGHTYEVWLEGTEIKAARDDGAPVGDAEAEALAEDHGDLGQVPPVARVIAGRTWNRKERVELGADELAGLSKNPAVKVVGGAFTWLGGGGGAAVFGTEARFLKDDDKGRIETNTVGKMQIDLAAARPTEMTTSGSSTGELRGAMAGTKLEGTMASRASYRYE